jgi:hypothetical protein
VTVHVNRRKEHWKRNTRISRIIPQSELNAKNKITETEALALPALRHSSVSLIGDQTKSEKLTEKL